MSARAMIAWGVLTLVAVVIVTAAVTKKVVAGHWAAEHPAAVAGPTASPASAPLTVRPRRWLWGTHDDSPQEAATAPTIAALTQTIQAIETKTAELDLDGLVGGLTLEQRQKLEAEWRRVQTERSRLAARYQMPSDTPFFSLRLAGQTRSELRLSEAQETQLKALEETEATLLRAQLAGVWWLSMDPVGGPLSNRPAGRRIRWSPPRQMSGRQRRRGPRPGRGPRRSAVSPRRSTWRPWSVASRKSRRRLSTARSASGERLDRPTGEGSTGRVVQVRLAGRLRPGPGRPEAERRPGEADRGRSRTP